MGDFRVLSPVNSGTQSKDLVDTRWVPAWKEDDGEKTVKARLAAKGFRDPDLRIENADTAGCVSRGSSHFRVTSLGALGKWPLWSLDIKNAFLRADGFAREVYLRAPCGRNSKGARRKRKLRAPAYGLNDTPAASLRASGKYLVTSTESPPSVGLRCEVSPFSPRMYFFPQIGDGRGGYHHTRRRYFGAWRTRFIAGSAGLFGKKVWGITGPGVVVCTCGHGIRQGAGFPCGVGPEGLYEEPEVTTHVSRAAGRAEGTLVDRLH